MKIKYKIVAAFVFLSLLLLAAICIFIYTYTAEQQEKDFVKRLENRTLTVAAVLFKIPTTDHELLSKIDSATSNLLAFENINVFNNRNQRIYRFARSYHDTVSINTEILNKARSDGYYSTDIDNKKLVAVYYEKTQAPVVITITAFDENGGNNLSDLKKSLIIAFVIGILLSFLAGLIFSTRLLKPVKKIITTVNNISAYNIERRLPVSTVKDEWNNLSETFNDLFARLQISLDVQGRFISNASHELSTPLTVVSNQIDVTLRKARSNEEYLLVFQSIQADIQHMSALTTHLLDIARTSRGGSIQTKPTRIDEIIMELPALIKKHDGQYNIHINFDDLPDDEMQFTLNGNHDLLLAAFKNICENGCKYSPDTTVNVSLSFIGKQILVLFSNNCDSFNPNELESIFHPFQRGSSSGSTKGHGLGLSLTRRIVLLHDGEISAEIITPGKILISVTLPSISFY